MFRICLLTQTERLISTPPSHKLKGSSFVSLMAATGFFAFVTNWTV